jgi:hypothetical protein
MYECKEITSKNQLESAEVQVIPQTTACTSLQHGLSSSGDGHS